MVPHLATVYNPVWVLMLSYSEGFPSTSLPGQHLSLSLGTGCWAVCPLVLLICFSESPGSPPPPPRLFGSPFTVCGISLVQTFLFTFLFKASFDEHPPCLLTGVSDPGSKQEIGFLTTVSDHECQDQLIEKRLGAQGQWQAAGHSLLAAPVPIGSQPLS